jgi:hypothetical protein
MLIPLLELLLLLFDLKSSKLPLPLKSMLSITMDPTLPSMLIITSKIKFKVNNGHSTLNMPISIKMSSLKSITSNSINEQYPPNHSQSMYLLELPHWSAEQQINTHFDLHILDLPLLETLLLYLLPPNSIRLIKQTRHLRCQSGIWQIGKSESRKDLLLLLDLGSGTHSASSNAMISAGTDNSRPYNSID